MRQRIEGGVRQVIQVPGLLPENHEVLVKLEQVSSNLKALLQAQPGANAITVQQTAARLGCGTTRIFDLLKSGALKRGKKVGRSAMVLVSSIDALTGATTKKMPAPRTKGGQAETKEQILKKLKQQL